MNLNQATICGRLTRDPEQKALPNGTAVTKFSLATSHTYKDRDGNKKETTEFHNIVTFGRTAEVAGQYLKKGQLACIVGRLQTSSWEKDGHKNYRTEILADSLQMGPRVGNSSESAQRSSDDDNEAPAAKNGAGGGIDWPTDDINPDDIPF